LYQHLAQKYGLTEIPDGGGAAGSGGDELIAAYDADDNRMFRVDHTGRVGIGNSIDPVVAGLQVRRLAEQARFEYDEDNYCYFDVGSAGDMDINCPGGDITLDGAAPGVTDHGALDGLLDDDHTQYLIEAPGTWTSTVNDAGIAFTLNASGASHSGLLFELQDEGASVMRVDQGTGSHRLRVYNDADTSVIQSWYDSGGILAAYMYDRGSLDADEGAALYIKQDSSTIAHKIDGTLTSYSWMNGGVGTMFGSTDVPSGEVTIEDNGVQLRLQSSTLPATNYCDNTVAADGDWTFNCPAGDFTFLQNVDAPSYSVAGVPLPDLSGYIEHDTTGPCVYSAGDNSWSPTVYNTSTLQYECLRPTDDLVTEDMTGWLTFIDHTGTNAGNAIRAVNRLQVPTTGDRLNAYDSDADQAISLGPCDGTDCEITMVNSGANELMKIHNPLDGVFIQACSTPAACAVGRKVITLQPSTDGSDGEVYVAGDLEVTLDAVFSKADGTGSEVTIIGDLEVGGEIICTGGDPCSTLSQQTGGDTAWTINADQVSHTGDLFEVQDQGVTQFEVDSGGDVVGNQATFSDEASGSNGEFDLIVGGTYGGLSLGNVGIYSSSFSASNLDLDKAVLFRQEGSIGVGNDPGIEFAWMEQGNTIRMAIPESGADNATAMIRSVTVAGPYSSGIGNDIVSCDQWAAYDSNIDCDTSGTGADLFVQDDLEVEGTLFLHETINLEGATADGNQVIIQVGADPGADVTLTLPTTTGTLALTSGSVASLDSDGDGNPEFATNVTDETIELDLDSDGTIDRRRHRREICTDYGFWGDNVANELFVAGTSGVYRNATSGNYGAWRNYTSSSTNADAAGGMFRLSTTTSGALDPADLLYYRWVGSFNYALGGYRAYTGILHTATSANWLTINKGIYFSCAPVDDIDNSGAGAGTIDKHLWACASNGDTDSSGKICATMSGNQCATYTATNTTCWNTEVTCDAASEVFLDLEIECEKDYSECRYYVDGALETTISTNLPTAGTLLWGAGWAIENGGFSSKNLSIDHFEVCHEPPTN
jgi:hypothetical protein